MKLSVIFFIFGLFFSTYATSMLRGARDRGIQTIAKRAAAGGMAAAENGDLGPLRFRNEADLAELIEVILRGCGAAGKKEAWVWTTRLVNWYDTKYSKAAEDERNLKVATVFLTTAVRLGHVVDHFRTLVHGVVAAGGAIATAGEAWMHELLIAVGLDGIASLGQCTADGKAEIDICRCGNEVCRMGQKCASNTCADIPAPHYEGAMAAISANLGDVFSALATYFRANLLDQSVARDAKIALGGALWRFGKEVIWGAIKGKAEANVAKAMLPPPEQLAIAGSKTAAVGKALVAVPLKVASSMGESMDESNFILEPGTLFALIAMSLTFFVVLGMYSLRRPKTKLYEPLNDTLEL